MQHIIKEREGEILIAKIDRPQKLNALNRSVIGELGEIIDEVRGHDEIKGLIITGVGDKAFAAGADISEFQEYPKEEAMLMSKRGHEVFQRIETSPKPVIAAIHGFCLGGGCELAMAAHMRISARNSKFGLPEVSLGLLPGYGGTQRLPQLVGKAKALELILTGEMIDADDAKQIGLVNQLVSFDELLPKSLELMKKITSKAPIAVGEIIKSVNAYFNHSVNGFEQEMESFSEAFETEDFQEGVSAFLEKREPVFTGK